MGHRSAVANSIWYVKLQSRSKNRRHSWSELFAKSLLDDQTITTEQWESNFTFFIDSVVFARLKSEVVGHADGKWLRINETNTLWIGYRELSEAEKRLDWKNLPIPYPYADQINTTLTFRGFTTICDFIEKGSTRWENRGCRVTSVKLDRYS